MTHCVRHTGDDLAMTPMKPHPSLMACKFRFIFTLIELLVVISIIAVLLTMLLPALRTTKEQGGKINCLNNLKQISQAVLTYCDDYNGAFPPSRYSGSGLTSILWPRLICPDYMKGWPSATGGYFGAMRCPAFDNDSADNYGINSRLNCPTFFSTRADYIQRVTRSNSQVPFVFDACTMAVRDRISPLDAGWGMGHGFEYRHPKLSRGNLSFCDGHVESVTPSSWTTSGYNVLAYE